MQFILQAGFSTAAKVTQISGRGVGMDVVHSEIKQMGGAVIINSVESQGTEFVVRLPFTVSVNRALMVRVGEDLYAIPLNSIEGIVRVSPYELEQYYASDKPILNYSDRAYHLDHLGHTLMKTPRPSM
jgi:chemosensory pili system protein ChpA (sensor histidine kinase/response regulator)